MKFIKRVLIFFVVNTAFVSLIITINPFSHPTHQLLAFALMFTVTGLIAYLMYRLKERRIWYIPISQLIMCFGCCIFFYIRDLLGYRKSGGFLDFGVGFEIMVAIYISLFLIIPSVIAAIVYAKVMKKRTDIMANENIATEERKKLLQKIALLCCMAASIVLMALPYGVRISFEMYSGRRYVHRSYFSGLTIGYANWFPMITAVLSIAVTILLFAEIIRKNTDNKMLGKAVFICLCVCIITSLLSWIIFDAVSIFGVLVFVLHAATLVFVMMFNRNRRVVEE